jgi:hypothetical protein
LRIVLDDPIEQSSHEMILDAQRNLNSFLDNLWNVIDHDNIEDLNEIILSIRNIFNSLFQLIQEQQKKQTKLSEDIIKWNQDVAMLKMSEAELLLGAMGTQLIIKCSHYLKINEPLHITKFRTMGMLNTNENIAVLKDFLKDNGYDWNYLSIIIQMLKCRRAPAAHPSNNNTTGNDIKDAIDKVYPNMNSKDRDKAQTGLSILETLAKELNETLFISTEN